MNPLWPLEKGLTSLKTKQRGICIWSRNTPTALCLNITWLEGLSILKTASSSSRNLPLFEMCKTAPENWLVTPWAATLSTLLQNQVSVSERPFLNLFLWRFFCLVGLVFWVFFLFFLKWAGLLRLPHWRGCCKQMSSPGAAGAVLMKTALTHPW